MSDGPRLAVLINPTAAHARNVWRAREILSRRFRVVFHSPSTPAEMQRVATEEINSGCAAIVAAGGDGTINCVVNALARTTIPLAILPLGTANDLARELGLPIDAAAAAERIVTGSPRQIDLVAVNARRFCTVGGMGLVARSALAVDRWRNSNPVFRVAIRPFGAQVYSLSGAANIAFAPQRAWRIHLVARDAVAGSATEFDGVVHGMFVANQRHVGATLALPLAADNRDGRFEICLLNASSRLRLLWLLATFKSGRPPPPGSVTVLRATEAVITCDRATPFLGDGDEMDAGERFEVRSLPAALSVIC